MLARLVVHLQANYGQMNRGLRETANRANEWQGSMTSAAAGARLVADAADAVSTSATAASSALRTLSWTSRVTGMGFQVLDGSTAIATGGIQTVAASSRVLEPIFWRLANVTQAIAQGFAWFAAVFRRLAAILSFGGTVTRTLARGLGLLSASIQAVLWMVKLLTTGLMILMWPLKAVGTLGMWAFSGLGVAVGMLLLPFRALWVVLTLVTRGIMAIVKPLASLAVTIMYVWFVVKGWMQSLKLLWTWLNLLPLKIRLMVGAVLALGAAGQAGSFALNMLARGARVAGIAMQILLLPIQLIRHPMRAASSAMSLLGMAALKAASMARTAAAGFWSLLRSTASLAGGVFMTAASHLWSFTKSMIKAAFDSAMLTAKLAALAGVVGIVWGAKLAAQAEQAEIAFTTLLRNGDVAKNVLKQIQQFASETPFALGDLREGAQNLLAFGVGSNEVMDKLRMLGDIAAGTGKPITDFTSIFGKVKSTGKVSLEQLNQLAERGVPIYSALADTLGVSRTEMLKMISDGKVGFHSLDEALKSTTSAGGIFAGGMKAQSQSTIGLISTLKDNIGEVFMELSGQLMEAFNFKAILAGLIAFTGTAKGYITRLIPVIQGFAAVVTAYVMMVWQKWQMIFSGIASFTGATFDSVVRLIVRGMAMAEFAFTNWKEVGMFAMAYVALKFMQFGGWLMHFFTTEIPAYLSYFAENFTSVILNAVDYVSTIFINLGQNIRNIMGEIWDFIASGGSNALELTWTPLTDGFRNTLKQMQEIPAREIGPLEAQMQSQVDSLGSKLKTGMDGMVAERLKQLDDFNAASTANLPPQPNLTGQNDQPVEDTNAGAGGNGQTAAGALKKNSAEAFSAIFAAQRDKQNDRLEKESVKHTQLLGQIANGISNVTGFGAFPVVEGF